MAELLRWYERHPVITLGLIVYTLAAASVLLWLFVVVTLQVFGLGGEIPNIPGTGGTVVAYAGLPVIISTVVALVASAKSLWRWWRGRDGQGEG